MGTGTGKSVGAQTLGGGGGRGGEGRVGRGVELTVQCS